MSSRLDFPDSPVPRGFWLVPFLPILAAYVAGLFVPVFEVDAAQYANMSQEMAHTGSFLQLQHRGQDYLDKPPLLFWLSAALFQLLGPHTWVYKLPSLLVALLGVHAAGKFAEQWYGMRAGWTAALILASCVGVLLHTNDVRTDTLLMGWVAVALWQFSRYLHPASKRPLSGLVWGWMAVALAMLTKGPIGIMVPVLAVGVHLLARRELPVLMRREIWLIGVVVVAVVLAPMLLGLYQQYGWDGWYFYFWKQSFGRLTGENEWRDGSGPLFFTHTFLWLFLPWAPLALAGLVRQTRELWQRSAGEGFSWGGTLLPAVALSASAYKLPHYLMVILPMSAVLAAVAILPALMGDRRAERAWTWVLGGQIVLLVAVGILLAAWAFPLPNAWLVLPSLAAIGFGIWLKYRPGPERPFRSLVAEPAAWMAAIFLLLNLHLYPSLLRYQAGTQAGTIYRTLPEPKAPLVFLNNHSQALEYEGRGIYPTLTQAQVVGLARQQGSLWVYAPGAEADSLMRRDLVVDTLIRLPEYPITRLTPKFVNPATRAGTLQERVLLRVAPAQ